MAYDLSRVFLDIDPAYSASGNLQAPNGEMDTRLIPIATIECSYARDRLPSERTPVPLPGDPVYYRHNEWDNTLDRAVVVEVQDPGEREDPNLWRIVRDGRNRPVGDGAGSVLMTRVDDPWPWVILQTEKYGLRKTWESRVRGSAGWLPLNWRTRPIRLAHELILGGLG